MRVIFFNTASVISLFAGVLYLVAMNIGFDAKRIFYNASGLGNYSRFVVRTLTKYYPEIHCHLFTPGYLIEKDFLHHHSHVTRHSPHTFLHKKFPSLWRSGGLLPDLQRNGIQVYHGLSNELPASLEKTGINTVVTIHDLIFLHFPDQYPAIDRRIYERKFKSAIERANHVIAVSEQTAADIRQMYSLEESRLSVITQDCDPMFGQKPQAAHLQQVQLHYRLQRPFILSVGTIEKRKNHLQLVKAFQEGSFTDMDLIIMGKKADAFPDLQQYINKNGLQERVRFLEGVPFHDFPSIFHLAHGTAYLSTYEGFGIPVLESLRTGTPVLASNISSIPEVAGLAGVLVNPHDIQSIIKGLNTLVFDTGFRTAFPALAATQTEKFDAALIGSQFVSLYQKLKP